jgi:hypothetical protein
MDVNFRMNVYLFTCLMPGDWTEAARIETGVGWGRVEDGIARGSPSRCGDHRNLRVLDGATTAGGDSDAISRKLVRTPRPALIRSFVPSIFSSIRYCAQVYGPPQLMLA